MRSGVSTWRFTRLFTRYGIPDQNIFYDLRWVKYLSQWEGLYRRHQQTALRERKVGETSSPANSGLQAGSRSGDAGGFSHEEPASGRIASTGLFLQDATVTDVVEHGTWLSS